jgi:hypothetical protein
MSDGKVHELCIRTDDGKLVPVRVRVKGRCDQDGVEGVLLALLHPNNTDFEVMEMWAPITSNPELDALLHDRRPE